MKQKEIQDMKGFMSQDREAVVHPLEEEVTSVCPKKQKHEEGC